MAFDVRDGKRSNVATHASHRGFASLRRGYMSFVSGGSARARRNVYSRTALTVRINLF